MESICAWVIWLDLPVVAAMEDIDGWLWRKEVWVVAGSWCKVESVGSSSVTKEETVEGEGSGEVCGDKREDQWYSVSSQLDD